MSTQVLSQSAISSFLDRTPIHSPNTSFDGADGSYIVDAEAQGVNRKLKRLAMDTRQSTKRQSFQPDHPENFDNINTKNEVTFLNSMHEQTNATDNTVSQLSDPDNPGRFPRMEELSHFHYTEVNIGSNIEVSLHMNENEELSTLDTGQPLVLSVKCKEKKWMIKRSHEDLVGFDKQIHRCLLVRKFSKLPLLVYSHIPLPITNSMVQQIQFYLSRFSQVAGNNVNCGPVLNWLELDNHGNHLVVMEADDSAINVPAVAAGRVIKRYQAQAPDEMTLEVGDFLSVIDMPPVEETIWWRGKKAFEVGFFPSHCVEVLGDKLVNEKLINHLNAPIANQKSRGKFVSFLRFFFKSRPSKDDGHQGGGGKGKVFGCDLGEFLAYTGDDVPFIISICCEVIEEHGVVDGIYRLSGITSNLQKLKMAFDNDDTPPDLRDMRYLNDVHCISSLMKTYFRELPNPLFTYELYEKFVTAIKKDDDAEKTVAFHHVIQRLPPPHYRTMNKLFRHLNLCASHSGETNMTAKNLSIVWAPNLLRPNVADTVAALTEFRTQAVIVEYMIRNVGVFFDNNLASAAIAYYPEVQELPQAVPGDETAALNRTNFMNLAPKLISLEEARRRATTANHRKVSETYSLDSASSNSPRHNKLRASTRLPPKVAATPVSPLPSLLSLEEAQARSSTRGKMAALPRRGSADIIDIRRKENLNNVNVSSPKRNRKWFGLFTSRSKSPNPQDGFRVNSVNTYRKKDGRVEISGPIRSQSEQRIQDIEKEHQRVSYKSSDSTWFIPIDHSDSDEGLEFKKISNDDDGESLLSAVVAVREKYMNNDNVNTTKHRRSVTIGEPSEFRRIADSALLIAPPANIPVTERSSIHASSDKINERKLTHTDSNSSINLPNKNIEKFIRASNNFYTHRSHENITEPDGKHSTQFNKDSTTKSTESINLNPLPNNYRTNENMNLSVNPLPNNYKTNANIKSSVENEKEKFKSHSSSNILRSLQQSQNNSSSIPDNSRSQEMLHSPSSNIIRSSSRESFSSPERKHVLNKSDSTENILPVKRIRSMSPEYYSSDSLNISTSPVPTSMNISTSPVSTKTPTYTTQSNDVIKYDLPVTVKSYPVKVEEPQKQDGRTTINRTFSIVATPKEKKTDSKIASTPEVKTKPVILLRTKSVPAPDEFMLSPHNESIVSSAPNISLLDKDTYVNSYYEIGKETKKKSYSSAVLSNELNKTSNNGDLSRERSYSQDSNMDQLVSRSQRSMNELPERDYDLSLPRNNDVTMLQTDTNQPNVLVKSTQERSNPHFISERKNEFVLKKQHTIDEIKLKENKQNYVNTSNTVKTNKQNYVNTSNTVKASKQNYFNTPNTVKTNNQNYVNTPNNLKENKQNYANIASNENKAPAPKVRTNRPSRTDLSSPNPTPRPRALSVKDRAAIFSNDNDTAHLNKDEPQRPGVGDRTKSQPNLYLRTEFSSRQSPLRTLNISTPEKENIKKYTSVFNKRHTTYENSSTYSSAETLSDQPHDKLSNQPPEILKSLPTDRDTKNSLDEMLNRPTTNKQDSKATTSKYHSDEPISTRQKARPQSTKYNSIEMMTDTKNNKNPRRYSEVVTTQMSSRHQNPPRDYTPTPSPRTQRPQSKKYNSDEIRPTNNQRFQSEDRTFNSPRGTPNQRTQPTRYESGVALPSSNKTLKQTELPKNRIPPPDYNTAISPKHASYRSRQIPRTTSTTSTKQRHHSTGTGKFDTGVTSGNTRNYKSSSQEVLSSHRSRSSHEVSTGPRSRSTSQRSMSEDSLSQNISNLNNVIMNADKRITNQLSKQHSCEDSGDELVNSTYSRSKPTYTRKTRPSSEFVRGAPNIRARSKSKINYENDRGPQNNRQAHPHFSDYVNEPYADIPQHSQFSTRNESPAISDTSHHTSESPDLRSRHAEQRNSNELHEQPHYTSQGRQIGNFPLTLYNGNSVNNSRIQSIQNTGNRVQPVRPVSMYDNHRKSYYDNVQEIHYEML